VAPVSPGMPGWELALIIVGAALVLALAGVAITSRLRRTPRPVSSGPVLS
jgi:hypothetical protein